MKHIITYDEFNVIEGKGAVSKALKKATEAYHDAQLKQQNLQKQFIATPKTDTKKREEIKKLLIAQSKIVKKAEEEFNTTLRSEEPDDTEIF